MKNYYCVLFLLLLLNVSFYSQQNKNSNNQKKIIIPKDFSLVENGTFKMGDDSLSNFEKPSHNVTITNSFLICKHEVTNEEYSGSSYLSKNPKCYVTWFEAIEYCNKRSIKENLKPCYSVINDSLVNCDFNANGYRLPTEAEWEFAAKGGNKSKGFKYSGGDDPLRVACFWDNSTFINPLGQTAARIQKICTKKANELDIYDMSGNASEWCWDWFENYKSDAQIDPKGPLDGKFKIHRGGNFLNMGEDIPSCSSRDGMIPKANSLKVGFRVVRNIK